MAFGLRKFGAAGARGRNGRRAERPGGAPETGGGAAHEPVSPPRPEAEAPRRRSFRRASDASDAALRELGRAQEEAG